MFTGLIESTGTIESAQPPIDLVSGRVLSIATPMAAELTPGDSVSVNGVCLTVTSNHSLGFTVDVSPETLRVTTLGKASPGRVVNLERPLRADARLGGHFVLGHVDGVGRVRAFRSEGAAYWLEIDTPSALSRYFIPKGSVAVDGISLTIAALDAQGIGIQIIPFTWKHTALSLAQPGDEVNLEADRLGKYVVRLMDERAGVAGTPAAGNRT
jgi:riboflavin synthase